MKNFHPVSFVLGLASGVLVIILFVGAVRMVSPARQFTGGNGGIGQGANGGANLTRMAQRFGMTEEQLRTELDSGKTFQQIAAEHGVTFTGRRGNQNQGGLSASGSVASSAASQTTSSSSLSHSSP